MNMKVCKKRRKVCQHLRRELSAIMNNTKGLQNLQMTRALSPQRIKMAESPLAIPRAVDDNGAKGS